LAKAARKGNPIAQNRLANILAVGRGLQANAVEAVKWHIIAKAGGVSDIPLDTFVQKQTPEIREAGEKAAKPWLDALKGAARVTHLTWTHSAGRPLASSRASARAPRKHRQASAPVAHPHAPLRPSQRDDQGRTQGEPHAQA
jgi:FOG: TPR repeat, SEL1 subfamily